VLKIDGFVREMACEAFFKRGTKQKSISQIILKAILKVLPSFLLENQTNIGFRSIINLLTIVSNRYSQTNVGAHPRDWWRLHGTRFHGSAEK